MGQVKISSYQFLVLVIFFSVGTSLLAVPAILAERTGQDAWIAAAIGSAVSVAIVSFYVRLACRFPGLTFIEMIELLLGKWIGRLVTLFFVLAAMTFTATLLYYSGSFLKIEMMPRTPMLILNLFIGAVIVQGVYMGLETLARSAEIFIGVFLLLFGFLLVSLLPQVKFEQLMPVSEAGAGDIAWAAFSVAEVSGLTAVVLLVVFPAFTKDMKKSGHSFLIGNLIAGILVTALTFLSIVILGAESTAKQHFPGYELAKRINLGDFVQRVESLMAGLWVITLFFKASLYFFAAVYGTARLFKLSDYRRLTFPLGGVAVILSLTLFPNIMAFKNWNTTIGAGISISVGVALPLLLAVVYGLRRKGLKRAGKVG